MEKKLSAEEVLDKNYEPGMHWKTVNRQKVLSAMQEYASQFKGEAVSDAEILKYVKHLPHCNTMQDWTEAQEALSYCPDGPDKDQAYNEMRKKMITCTCGLGQILKNPNNE